MPILANDPIGNGAKVRGGCIDAKKQYPSSVDWEANCNDADDCEWIAKAMQRMCSVSLSRFLSCVQGNCGETDIKPCFDDICSGRKKLRFSCPGWFGNGCCDSKTCACTVDGVTHLCWSPSWSNGAKGCQSPHGCSLIHELMHICGFIHFPGYSKSQQDAAAKLCPVWTPDNKLQDCLCFTCLRFVPGCASFGGYRDDGKTYFDPKDCSKIEK